MIHTHHTASYAHHLKLSKEAVNQEKSTMTWWAWHGL